MTSPLVVAVVLNWCAEDDTAACLRSLAASGYDNLTVLLVDNASPDGSGNRLRARFPALPYLQTGGNYGYAGGNNRGIDWALVRGANYVLVVNDDAVVQPGAIGALVGAAEETGAAAVGPQIRALDDPDVVVCGAGHFSRMRALGVHHEYRAPPDSTDAESRAAVSFVSGCCVLLRTDTLRELGAFDDAYFAYVEDAELSLRFVRAGRTLIYEPSARVLHPSTRGTPTPFQIRQGNFNRRRLAARHYGTVDRAVFRMWFYATRLAHLGRYLLRGDGARAAATARSAFGPLPAATASDAGER
jgi:GT2 family glycosyltransferase